MRISDWSSDVCSSDLAGPHGRPVARPGAADLGAARGLGKTIQKAFWLMDETVAARIKQEIDDNQVVIFMKGTPVFPHCGFSAAVVHILSHLNVTFKGVDVLQDPDIRQGIKDFKLGRAPV